MEPRSEARPTELTGSTVIWAIMAVTGLWLVGLFALGVGYTLVECLGACSGASPEWVWWLSSALALGCFVFSGRIAVRMTGLSWTWSAAAPGLIFLLFVF